MSISSFVGRVLPAATAFVASGGNPLAAATSFAAADKARDDAKKAKLQNEKLRSEYQRSLEMTIGLDAFGGQGRQINTMPVSTQSSGGGFFDTIRGGLREIGGFTQDLFTSGLPQLFGFNRPPSVRQQPALTTVTNVGAQESQGSGTIQAGLPAAVPALLGGARSLLTSKGGQLALGGGLALGTSLIGPDGKTMRVTRKMKSQARMVLNLAQGNISVAADILNVSEDMLIAILLKRFRNDGPVVTKAALRKTKSTIRKLHNMQDVLKSITPTASGRRRATTKRGMTTTLIKN
jgi:hypothetical protein|tara:strand:- start:177 stop:1052 length:876 start_codon:yes stop_codon:yes gene_type:complete